MNRARTIGVVPVPDTDAAAHATYRSVHRAERAIAEGCSQIYGRDLSNPVLMRPHRTARRPSGRA
jgi:hypothetical protein